jgi:hypothetical protein
MVPYGGGEAFVVSPPVVDQSSNFALNAQYMGWTHTVGTGNNRLLLVAVSIRNGATHVANMNYRGVPLSFLSAQTNSDNAVRVELWYLNAPPSGTGSISLALTGATKMVAGAVSFSGVDPMSPVRNLSSMGGTSNTTDPAVTDSSAASELVFAAASLEGSAGTLTAGSGLTQRYLNSTGSAGGEALGVGGTAVGASNRVMTWAKSAKARWAIAAAVIKPFVPSGLSLTSYQASFWAKRGTSRTLQINYAANGGTSPFMQLTVSDPTYAPGRGNLAVGDSVLMTATIDPNNIAVDLQPTGVLFGTPAQLQFWYGGANGDLNGDGVVDAADSAIESQLLGMWYQEGSTNPWTAISATQSLSTKSFTAALQHFSGYAVSW